MQRTSIEWTDRSVNPFRARRKDNGKVGWHCVKYSPGCSSCYSEVINGRFGTGLPYTARSADLVELFLDDRMLSGILRLKTPQKVFPCDMTDLFQEGITTEDIATFFGVMAVAYWHTFQILTKRSDRMRNVVRDPKFPTMVADAIDERVRPLIDGKIRGDWGLVSPMVSALRRGDGWPLPNVWKGVSVEDQKRADERIPDLIQTPAAVRFLSVEPLIGPVDLFSVDGPVSMAMAERNPRVTLYPGDAIDWTIVGGESGHDARPMNPAWVRSIRDQCQASGVAFFLKQNGEFASVSEVEGPGRHHTFPDGATVCRVGKKAAGRMLDGRTWDQIPNTEANPR